MSRAEYIELGVIAAAGLASWFIWPHLPHQLIIGEMVLAFSALLLAQSLVRDLAILLRKRRSAPAGPAREVQCFCLESTVGSTGVFAGAALVALGSSRPVAVGQWSFALGLAATMLFCFMIKDLVISWNPLGLRREKDHLNLIVRWKPR